MMLVWAAALLVLAGLPTVMTAVNLVALRRPVAAPAGTRVAVLIPARDEAAGIAACVEAALASIGVGLEVVVLDDHSTDATAAIVAGLAQADPRLRLASAPPLPVGWSGKQHACHVLSGLTDAPLLVFLDADVQLQPDAAARLAGALARSDLVSGVPRQRMESLPELLVIPMINALLLGYLPIPFARRSPRPALAAGCGQMIAVRADAYARSGGHAAIRTSLHDGLTLPRLFRAAGLRTDLVAGASLATCRMYAGWRAVVRGTTKNAAEGLAKPVALPVWTVLLLGGHVAPWVLLAAALAGGRRDVALPAALGCAGPLGARLLQAVRCREPLWSAPLSPFGVVLLLVLQWRALLRRLGDRPETWRGRSYPAGGRAC